VASLYDEDFVAWAEETARAIAEERWSDIDREALREEVASLGRQERARLDSRLTNLLLHLLKTRYQPKMATRSWKISIGNARDAAEDILRENPSLKPVLGEILEHAYRMARRRAARETGLDAVAFPETNPFTEAEIWGEGNGA
jgi:hypothetical protein